NAGSSSAHQNRLAAHRARWNIGFARCASRCHHRRPFPHRPRHRRRPRSRRVRSLPRGCTRHPPTTRLGSHPRHQAITLRSRTSGPKPQAPNPILKIPGPNPPNSRPPSPKKRCGTLSPRQTPHTLLTLFARATRHTRVVTTPQVSRKSPAPLSFRPIAGLYSIFPGASQALLGLSDRRLPPPPDTQKLPTLRHFRTSFHRYLRGFSRSSFPVLHL